jgi:hypothetical protein
VKFPHYIICFAPEGADSGAQSGVSSADAATDADAASETDAGSAAGAAAQGDAADQGTAASQAGAPSIYRPEGLADHLLGATDQETIDRLAKAYSGARETIAKAGEVPKDPAGYAIQPSDKIKPYTERLDQDPFWSTTKEIAHKHHIPGKTFQGFIGDLMEAMVEKNLVAEPFSPEKERAALVPDITDPKARATVADRIIRDNIATIDAWKEQGLPEDAAVSLKSTMDRAATNHLVNWIREARGEQPPAMNGGNVDAKTEAEFDRRMADPRNNLGSPKYDPAFAAETDRMAKDLWPDRPE